MNVPKTFPDILFRAQQLLDQFNRVEVLKSTLMGKMLDDIAHGKHDVSWYNYPEKEQIAEGEGILDRARRDLVHQLSQAPSFFKELCEEIVRRGPKPVNYRGFIDEPSPIPPEELPRIPTFQPDPNAPPPPPFVAPIEPHPAMASQLDTLLKAGQ